MMIKRTRSSKCTPEWGGALKTCGLFPHRSHIQNQANIC